MTTVGPHLLGRLVEHDPRSWNYKAPMRRVAHPRSVMWTNNAPILDQGELGSCVGNSAAEWLNCAVALKNRQHGKLPNRRRSRTYLNEHEAVELYAEATGLDENTSVEYPPTDCGTSGLGVAKAMQKYGFIDGYDWAFGFNHFLSALQLAPCLVGINWYVSMYETDKAGYVTPVGQDPDGGHEMLARGIDVALQRIRFRNHWTKDWGIKGECWMTFAVVERLLNEQGDVMVPRFLQ